MKPTIHSGDRVIAVKHLLMGRVERGDLVLMKDTLDGKNIFVKRVVGVPGDRIRLANRQLYLNGNPVSEPYVEHSARFTDMYRDHFPASEPNTQLPPAAVRMLQEHRQGGEIVVPDAHYFVLGDNRDDSLDSRYWGFLPRENVLGRPVFIYASPTGQTQSLKRVALP
jgi:signal peptidase I